MGYFFYICTLIKTITHRFLNREVIICYNFKKQIICYVLNSVTPNFFSRPIDNTTKTYTKQ